MPNLKKQELIYLSKEQVASLNITMEECVDTLEEVYRAKSNKLTQMNHANVLGDSKNGLLMRAYLGAILNQEKYAMKWLTVAKKNAEIGLPTINGLIILNHPETLVPVAVMDCTHITGLRTAAISGLAMKHLAKKDTTTMTVLGCGLQGRTHLSAAVATMKNLKKVYVWGPRLETAKKLQEEMQVKHPNVEIVVTEDAKKSIKESTLITSSTPFKDPDELAFIDPECLAEGTTFISISGLNHMLHSGYKSMDKLFVDNLETAKDDRVISRKEFGDISADVCGEIGDVIEGKISGRTSEEQKIVFFSGGLAINDVAISHLAYKYAKDKGVGYVLPL